MRSRCILAGIWALLATAGGAVAEPGSLAGPWEGVIVIQPSEYELELTLEVEKAPDGSLQGQISYPTQDVLNHPLESMKVEGDAVSFVVKDEQGVVSTFEGLLSAGGQTIQGQLAENGAHYLFEIRRMDPAKASAVKPLASLVDVSADGRELRALFNKDRGTVRLLAILSPTCPMCLNGARLIQRYLLDAIQDPDLRVYVIWEPNGSVDTREKARQSSVFISDPRVHQLWSPDRFAGKVFQNALGVKDSPAWDVFLLFAADRQWLDTSPAVDSFMHNLLSHKELSRERRLNGARLAGEVTDLLARQGVQAGR